MQIAREFTPLSQTADGGAERTRCAGGEAVVVLPLYRSQQRLMGMKSRLKL